MTTLRLVADDLTGALDTAAALVPLAGPLPVLWADALPHGLPPSCAIDTGTRERDRAHAIRVLDGLAPMLGAAALGYAKVDSLLRGHAMAELAACLRGGAFDACIVAPAFPHQGRITRGGVQHARRPDGSFAPVADVAALLAQAGIEARRADPDAPLKAGVSLFDAQSEADLVRIAALGRAAPGRVLWCGSAGLAQALSTHALSTQALAQGAARTLRRALAGPVLGLFGSDQAATAHQLDACGEAWVRLAGTPRDAEVIAARLSRGGAVMASLDLPPGLARDDAAARIAAAFAALTARLPRPGTLLVAGGETLRGLCAALGASALTVHRQIEPGLPVSTMRGGRWDGVAVVSKSGAFGGPTLWRDLLAADGFLTAAGRVPERASA